MLTGIGIVLCFWRRLKLFKMNKMKFLKKKEK